MKKRTIIILSILLILIPALFVVIKGSLVMHSVVHKEEKRFCPPAPIDLVQPKDRKLIKTGDLSFECANLGETRREIEAAVKQHGGFIVNERLYHGYNKKTSNQALKIRVPSERFDALVADISKGAQRVDQRTIVIEDVTEQYIDTETRLAVKCQLETRYRELLTEAKTVKDILSIEEQLATLREDIESAEGKLKRLDDQVALSTLDVTYYVSLDESPEFARYFRNGLGNGWENLVWFFVGLLNIWPFILIVVLLVGGFIYRKKRKTN
ncbi:hypothetical protein PDESU_03568 [Pontiella desulfatans]|uniref:DUF4349 domain-containing protein n=1 Tax=Pontiella desulfatans TaxID=2750659 RepID=A0A6C2U4J7_PONDE|nr:DUF4349 domain-containing protein [Pontiella desulfatans]VGO14988.1 hypothetical protein PDESU_03568 [Pontiella desulfatans]